MAILLLLPVAAYSDVGSTAANSTALRGWWTTHVLPSKRAEACHALVAPSGSTNTPHLYVYVYNDYTAGAGVGITRTTPCLVSGNNMYVYCGSGTPTISVKPNLIISPVSLRSFDFTSDTVGTINGLYWEVYGYFCSTTGCFGAVDSTSSVSLDGVATSVDLMIDVTVTCQ